MGVLEKGHLLCGFYIILIKGAPDFRSSHMAVSKTWRFLFRGCLTIRALLLGVYIRAPDFGETPN